ncbi:hypothetical protein COCC4DRAFT_58716 [Bipolaris maydis ATCC 48331]|uniref:Uncharacterized protein n=2 Tax=Cochliobolus heterostrophus TaxID=5016 RepID=M2V1S5_COCH5|nr:uncharacterized protein COCC4DRAFT_58716 [Bipolaris maydis ATCC 48331]EMD93877.1 hypothetical protein COCHEDRAFT_1094504 [Bipolaris maydis C5]ENI07819.1 hypothetical protein COCC4DRAFT_58716 [Bipolaris maydis ATCC 48331]
MASLPSSPSRSPVAIAHLTCIAARFLRIVVAWTLLASAFPVRIPHLRGRSP